MEKMMQEPLSSQFFLFQIVFFGTLFQLGVTGHRAAAAVAHELTSRGHFCDG